VAAVSAYFMFCCSVQLSCLQLVLDKNKRNETKRYWIRYFSIRQLGTH